MKKFLHGIAFILLVLISAAQSVPVNDNNVVRQYSFIHPFLNRILSAGSLDSFYHKLYELKKTGKGTLSIVHIGDSHTQADFLPAVVREGLQEIFGNAGRGLVFPYQLAQSNAPADISSSSNVTWQFNRIAHPEIPVTPGISGYSIQTTKERATINLSLKTGTSGPQTFNRLKFFIDSNESSPWILKTTGNGDSIMVRGYDGSYREITLATGASSFSLSSPYGENINEFYGVSLENSQPGILYHVIGVNGARYDHYNAASVFWKQLQALKADLFIISLGTNEAQRMILDEPDFQRQVLLFLQKLKMAAPEACILITTAADSFRGRKPNAVLKQVNYSLVDYCDQHHIAAWDLYRITGGYGSAYNWMKRRLMNRDKIHFTAEGYRIQGNLLLNALIKGYNSYVQKNYAPGNK